MSEESYVMNSSELKNRIRNPLIVVMLLGFAAGNGLFSSLAQAASDDELDAPTATPVMRSQVAPPIDKEVNSPTSGTRNFYTVMDEILSDFEYDLRTGQVMGLKDLSIRNVVTSENIPNSFRSHLELLISERILKSTKTRIVHCLACRSRTATLKGGQMVISSPENNTVEMQRIAKMNGIQNFMDVAYAYQPAGMMLSLQISDAETGTMLWSKNYNSETTRAAAQRRGVDFNAIEEAKTKMEYTPMVQSKPSLSFAFLPKAGSGYTTALGIGYRMMERYDNRKKEVGFEMNYFMDIGNLVRTGTPDPTNLWTGFNITLLFTHGWGLFGDEENYNKPRGVVYAAVGGTYTSGFLGGVLRGSYESRLAKHWAVTGFLGYRPTATLVIGSSNATLNGVEGGVGVGFLF
ncbi:MAG: hypothetical protein JST80_08195 [Bdellovibrionales bacterium]|nr:hypothetical protein [Bdellovibrionales bacterium]